MPIDYEKEYDNRARVPEHPQIFARWQAETEAYRKTARGAVLGTSYGPSARQTIDFFPGGDTKAPLALFVHGGWWRSLDPAMFSQMAKGANGNGIDVAIVGYDLCPTVTIATIIGQIRTACLALWRKHGKRIMVYGHSAGGHLAACMLATDWSTIAGDAPADLVPAAYSVSGVFDLAPLMQVSQNQDLRLDAASARACSPLFWHVPAGRTLDSVVGGIESSEFLRQSKMIVDAWQGAAQTRYTEIIGANHFTVVDPLTDAASTMTQRVVELAKRVAEMA
jgi:arylformamidase